MPTIASNTEGRHYPALDGVRGLAILLVLMFHGFLGLNWSTALGTELGKIPLVGWIGVDIFFVLSGFLITGILLDTRCFQHKFFNFYSRRFVRIFPVYWLLLGFIFFIVPLFKPFDTEGLATIARNQGWMWTYLTNVGYVYEGRAWATADWLELGHLWSLAVEEQFYLVWPLLVFFTNRRLLKIACVLCIIGSPMLRCLLWLMHMKNGALYFPTPCRLDGLGMGALAALLLREYPGVLRTPAVIAAAVGSAIIASVTIWRGGFQFNDSPTIVFGITGVCLVAVAVIVFATDTQSAVARIFSNSTLRSAGKYSYAVYLFHEPLRPPLAALIPDATLADAFSSELVGRTVFTLIFIAVSFALGYASWHLYEKHWLKLKRYFASRGPQNKGARSFQGGDEQE